MEAKKNKVSQWNVLLRDRICAEFKKIEAENNSNAIFERSVWDRHGGGGGQMSVMKGEVFEKVGVNISTVHGQLSAEFAKSIKGTEQSLNFWASGISIVAHMKNPHVPAIHFNTRMISTAQSWFGGGTDLTPCLKNEDDEALFHSVLKKSCDHFHPNYYPKFKKQCDEYFYLPHRKEARGIGGIFYDDLDSGKWEEDFKFNCAIGDAFLSVYPQIVRKNCNKDWTEQDKQVQLIKRGRYVEFNLLYDRGTKFGLMTGGNIDAIFMSLPPEVKWL